MNSKINFLISLFRYNNEIRRNIYINRKKEGHHVTLKFKLLNTGLPILENEILQLGKKLAKKVT